MAEAETGNSGQGGAPVPAPSNTAKPTIPKPAADTGQTGSPGGNKPPPPEPPANEPFSPLKPSGQGSFSRMDRLIAAATIFSGAVLLYLVVMQGLDAANSGRDYTKIFNLLMVGGGAFALGIFAGFIFGAAGEEKQSFSGIVTIMNGIIGGFALSDLMKNDSIIKAMLHSLGRACGMDSVGLVACVLAVFGTAGFMLMYMNKQYLLNPALSKKQQMAEQVQQLSALTRTIKVSLTDIGSQPKTDPKILDGLKTAIKEFETAAQKDSDLVELLSVETLKSYSKAYYVTGELCKAEAMLRRARGLSPDDPDTLFYLSHILITAQRPTEAIPYLSLLEALPNAPLLAWKLLGYACLFDPNRLDQAEHASKKYLCICPNDAGAILNLACVYGQRGPADADNSRKCIEYLTRAIALDATVRDTVKGKLSQPGEDFGKWQDNEDFKKL